MLTNMITKFSRLTSKSSLVTQPVLRRVHLALREQEPIQSRPKERDKATSLPPGTEITVKVTLSTKEAFKHHPNSKRNTVTNSRIASKEKKILFQSTLTFQETITIIRIRKMRTLGSLEGNHRRTGMLSRSLQKQGMCIWAHKSTSSELKSWLRANLLHHQQLGTRQIMSLRRLISFWLSYKHQ